MGVVGVIPVIAPVLFFCWHTTIQKTLRRAFHRDYFQTVVTANRLEFPALRKACEEPHAPVAYGRLRMMVKRDFLALTFLLKNADNVSQRYSREERLLMLYFRLVLVSLIVRHWLRLREEPAFLELAAILQYFANIVGERLSPALATCPAPTH